MFKWFNKLTNWLSEHWFLWAWDNGYESATHLFWVLVTFVGILLIGLFSSNVTLWISVLIGGGQLFAFVQELIRWVIAKKTGKGRQEFYIKNVFSNIIGIAIGGFLACLVWWIILYIF